MRAGLIIGVAVLLGIVLVVGGTFYTVRETEQVILTQFGKPIGDPVAQAGLTAFSMSALFAAPRNGLLTIFNGGAIPRITDFVSLVGSMSSCLRNNEFPGLSRSMGKATYWSLYFGSDR